MADFLILLYFSQGRGGKKDLASTQETQDVSKDLVSMQETNNVSTLPKEEADEAHSSRKVTSEAFDPSDSLVAAGSSREQPFCLIFLTRFIVPQGGTNKILSTQEDTIVSAMSKEGPSSREVDFPEAPNKEKQDRAVPSPEEGTHTKEIEPPQDEEVQ